MEEDSNHYTAFGSALPSLSEDEPIRKKPLRIEEQVATDENGRRRFHGAFTGGFSAGFYNTAGSRDGWAPKSFKSSRSQPRSKEEARTPNDFMDDDDRGSFGFAPQGLKQQEAFESRKRDHSSAFKSGEKSSCIPGEPVFGQIFLPVKDSIGVSLLKGMGWKEGKGIGPKLRRAKKKIIRKANARVQVRGDLKGHPSDSEEEEDEAFQSKYKDFLFSPDDVPLSLASPKVNVFGIGYKGLTGSQSYLHLFPPPPTTSAVKFKTKSGARGSIKGQAFGVGAYEEEDADIYGSENMSQYDFSLDNESPEKDNSRKRSKASRWGQSEYNEPNDIIDGFQRATKTSFVLSRMVYKAPQLPKNFKPMVKRVSRFEPAAKKANPRPSDRQAILALTDKKEESLSKEKIDEIEQILQSNKSSVASTSKEFVPFPDDPLKQKRYDDYLLCSKSNCGSLGLRLIHSKSSLSEAERESEALEFMRTKSLFKPLVSSMAAKFVSANQSEGARDKGPSSHLEHAVKSKSYGQLTREKVIWHPAPLLCVRFNVKNPYLGKDVCARSNDRMGLFSHILETEEGLNTTSLIDSTHSKTLDASKELHSIKSVTEDELPKEKPPIDLFKSIFLDSSDSEEDEEENVDADDVPSKEPPITEEKTQQRVGSSKIPTGVFAGIDLDSLVCKSKPPSLPPKPIPNTTTTSVCTDSKPKKSLEESSFGPALPPTGRLNSFSALASSSLDDGGARDLSDWGEKDKSSKHKKSKKSKKKKKKSSKSKRKSKKRRGSSSDETSSD